MEIAQPLIQKVTKKNERLLANWVKLQIQSDANLKEGKPTEVPAKYIDILQNQLVGFPSSIPNFSVS